MINTQILPNTFFGIQNFLDSLNAARKTPFEKVLFALGIRNVGETTAKMLARHYGDIDSLSAATAEELQEVGDIGEIIAKSIRDFFEEPRNKANIEKLKAAGLQFSMVNDKPTDNILEGQAIVITGTYSISRDEMKALIEAHGGKPTSSISAKTAFVLAGDTPGPEKVKKAGELGVKMISENDLYTMIGLVPSDAGNKELTLF